MSRLARDNRVLYFEPGRNPDRKHSSEMVRNAANFVEFRSRPVEQNLFVVPTPSCLPYARRHLPSAILQASVPAVAAVNTAVLRWQIDRAMRHFAVSNPILWLYEPRQIDLIGKFNEKLVCYYNYDETPDFEDNRRIRDLLRAYDNRLSSQADVVFATSRVQWTRRQALNPETYFVPNGVEFDLFHQALDPDLPMPADLAGIPGPILGFAGWLGYHIDVGLLVQIAESYPTCSLVLVGLDELRGDELAHLKSLPNVYFLGQKDRHELPGYLKRFAVALMPWAMRGHIYAAYPLKLHEYLAAGRAIVATPLPELRPFGEVIRIAETSERFLEQIGQALAEDQRGRIAERVAVARENTWEHRIAQIHEILDRRLSDRWSASGATPATSDNPAGVR